MRPVLNEKKTNYKLWIIYATIFIICLAGMAIALSNTNYFKEQNVDRALGFVDKESEKEDEYNELKAGFDELFTNQFEFLQEKNINVKKINNDYELVVTAFKYNKEEEYCTIESSIPYINVDNPEARKFNKEISEEYKKTSESLMNQISSLNVIYTVEYKAYIQNNILSLAIRSKYKEGNKEQKVEIKTFNYNLVENRKVTIDEILKLKNINPEEATDKIRKEIKSVQEQNQPLIEELGYDFYKRDYTSDKYDIKNSQQFLYGKDGMLYIIYAYGNEENTSETDIIIFT